MNPSKTFGEFVYDIVIEHAGADNIKIVADKVVSIDTPEGLNWLFNIDYVMDVPVEFTVKYIGEGYDQSDHDELTECITRAAWDMYTE